MDKNITEDYVSFETAVLLEKKGFPINEFHKDKIGMFNGIAVSKITNEMIKEKMLSCIPQSAVMKWLREKCKLCIEPYRTAFGYLYTISAIPYGTCIYNPTDGGDDEDSGQWTTYEKAVNEAIKYCLTNLIL